MRQPVRILALTNLYPPHHAGVLDSHCQQTVEGLRLRGHTVLVLTSSHGLRGEQRDAEVHRRLLLNGVFGDPAVAGVQRLKTLELHNHDALRETMAEFAPR